MNEKKLMQALFRARYPQAGSTGPGNGRAVDVLIQLPDNSPPVTFTTEVFRGEDSDTLILYPKPPVEGQVWDHDTNVITSHDPKREAVEAAVAAGNVDAVMDIVVEARRGRA